MSVLILGFKSCGKSTLGERLAKKLRLPFYDTDELLASAFQKKSAREVFNLIGEKAFREEEQKILMDLSTQSSCVVATGGGIVELDESKKWIETFFYRVFLNASLDEIKERIDPLYVFYHQLEKRYALRSLQYVKLSNIEIKTAGLNPNQVASLTLEAIRHYGQ
jgi:shikimate kinase